ncbi:MAG: HAD family hydrolase [Lachnospiraceae bacterium]|nr:HAD family hydrolase [Lachnospiraceae bacterium]
MERKYDAVVFDLDGTLLDTLKDLTDSVNAALTQYQMPTCEQETIRSIVGNGIRNLICKAVPDGEENPDFSNVFAAFKSHYGEHCMDATEPYPGIPYLLSELRNRGVKMAIVSNKADFAVQKLRDVYFGELIDAAVGEREGCRRKPEPDSVLQALEALGVSREQAVYVGDSEVDILTAKNAGVDGIIVTWGFRSRELLIEKGAAPERMAANVRELLSMLAG